MTVAGGATEHRGVAIDHADKSGRIAAAVELMLASDWEPEHAIHVRDLCLAAFDGLRSICTMSKADRRIVEGAALLHDVGFQFGQRRHHKSSFKIICAELGAPWTPAEALMVALVARYHRKAHPKNAHTGFADLPDEDRVRVRRLAAIIRACDGLDRTHTGAARIRCVESDAHEVTFVLDGPRSAVDEWGGQRKSQLFEDVFGRKLSLRWESGES